MSKNYTAECNGEKHAPFACENDDVATAQACLWWPGKVVTLREGNRKWKAENGFRVITFPLVTDSLGFRLELKIKITNSSHRGQHRTHEREGAVPADAVHEIELDQSLQGSELCEVIAHEAYHLFYSIRHLITVDEETEATVFGQLVKHIHALAIKASAPVA